MEARAGEGGGEDNLHHNTPSNPKHSLKEDPRGRWCGCGPMRVCVVACMCVCVCVCVRIWAGTCIVCVCVCACVNVSPCLACLPCLNFSSCLPCFGRLFSAAVSLRSSWWGLSLLGGEGCWMPAWPGGLRRGWAGLALRGGALVCIAATFCAVCRFPASCPCILRLGWGRLVFLLQRFLPPGAGLRPSSAPIFSKPEHTFT